MNSRERVLKTLEHEEPDKVPIDFGGAMCTQIAIKSYEKLRKFLGLNDIEMKISNINEQTVFPNEDILKLFNVDIRGVYLDFPPPIIEEKENGYYFTDIWGIKQRMPKVGGYYFDAISRPLQNANIEDLKEYNFPDPKDPIVEPLWEAIEIKAKKLYEESNYALVSGYLSGVFELSWNLRGLDKFLIDLIINKKFAEILMDKALNFVLAFWDELLNRVGEYVQVVQVGEDLGMQTGPIINPELFRKLIKPRDEKIFKFIKKKANVYLLLHSCGSIYKFIPDLIEMGVDALNPVQVSAKDMDTKKLKEEYGEKITFWGGGCNTQHILPHGSPEDVINEVKKRIKDLAPGGGFIFTQVHNIQADVPSENIVAMFETVKKYGWYPIKNIS
ncbi:MAG: uroporphyrinogen decarboxylase family protein [Nitrososphaerota archaeon]